MKKLVLAALLLAGCSSRTELLLGVATDLKAPDALDRVHVEVATKNDTLVLDWDISGPSGQALNLPGSYGLVSDNGSTRIDVALTGFKGEEALLTRRAVLTLVEDQTLFFRMGITAGCVGRDDCPQDWSCVEGVCRDVNVDSEQLPGWDPALVDELTCTAGVSYIKTETGEAMTVAAGADKCPNSLCYEGTCLQPPEKTSATRTITGTRVVTYVQQNKQRVQVPSNLTNAALSIVVPDGKGGARTLDGVGAADGTFRIDGAPNGPYFLKYDTDYFYTDADSIDLGYVALGRDSGPYPQAVTTINLANVTNMTAWASGDSLLGFAPDADAWWFNMELEMDPGLGATALTGYNFTSATGSGRLIANDAFGIEHLATKTSAGGDPYLAATQVFTPAPFTQVDGGTTNLSGSFVDVPQTQTMTFDVRAKEWDSAVGFDGTNATLLGPNTTVDPTYPFTSAILVDVATQPGGGAYGFFSATLDVLMAYLPHGTNKVLANLAFGEPVLGIYDWKRVVHAQAFFLTKYTVPGVTNPVRFYNGINDSRLATGPTMTITPSLGPVLSPKIADRDFLQPQQGVGLTPRITWDAPALGTATQYKLQIFDLTAPRDAVATVYTADTAVQLPPGLLESGTYYAIRITATNGGNIAAPFRQRYPDTYAMVMSGTIQP